MLGFFSKFIIFNCSFVHSSCLSVLTALSPKLPELLIGSVADIDAYEILLQIGFSTPQFEQVSRQIIGPFIFGCVPLLATN